MTAFVVIELHVDEPTLPLGLLRHRVRLGSYLIAGLLSSQADIDVIRTSDYIKRPKPNGYRSLHLIVTVPVFLSEKTEIVKVEIQIRTIAMDFWASLEHELSYKLADGNKDEVTRELKDCADVIADTDQRMQNLHNLMKASKR